MTAEIKIEILATFISIASPSNAISDINKDMVNRIAGLLTVISNGDIDKALKVLTFYASLSSDWATIKPDTENFYLSKMLFP